MARAAVTDALARAVATADERAAWSALASRGPITRLRGRASLRRALSRAADETALMDDADVDDVARRVAVLQLAWLHAAGRHDELTGHTAPAIADAYYAARADRRADAHPAADDGAVRADPGPRGRLVATLAVSVVALGAALGLGLSGSSDPRDHPVGRALADGLTDWVVALDRWAPMAAAGETEARQAHNRGALDAARAAMLTPDAVDALGDAHDDLVAVLDATERLASTAVDPDADMDGFYAAFRAADEPFREALRGANAALAAEGLPYFVDGDFTVHRRGYFQTALFAFHVVGRHAIVAGGGPDPASPSPARGALPLATHGHPDSSAASPSSAPASPSPARDALPLATHGHPDSSAASPSSAPASPNPARGALPLATHGHPDSSAASPSSDPASPNPARGALPLATHGHPDSSAASPSSAPASPSPARDALALATHGHAGSPAASPPVHVLHMRRIDAVGWGQGLLGYTRERMDVAVVLEDKVEDDLVTFVGPTLANAEPMPLFGGDTGGASWKILVEDEAGRVAREAFAHALPGRSEALRELGAALQARRALFDRWGQRLGKKGIRLTTPGSIAIPAELYASLKEALPDFQVDALEDVQRGVETSDNLEIFAAMLDQHAQSVERHEAQHRLDYAIGEAFVIPPELLVVMGVDEGDAAAAYESQRVRHAAFELSAYLSEVARDPHWSKLNLTLLARHVLDGTSGYAEYYAAVVVLEGLAEALYPGTGEEAIRVEGRVSPRKAGEIYIRLMDAEPQALSKAAHALWRGLFGADLPPLSRQPAP